MVRSEYSLPRGGRLGFRSHPGHAFNVLLIWGAARALPVKPGPFPSGLRRSRQRFFRPSKRPMRIRFAAMKQNSDLVLYCHSKQGLGMTGRAGSAPDPKQRAGRAAHALNPDQPLTL
jgi:hypothetical protein